MSKIVFVCQACGKFTANDAVCVCGATIDGSIVMDPKQAEAHIQDATPAETAYFRKIRQWPPTAPAAPKAKGRGDA